MRYLLILTIIVFYLSAHSQTKIKELRLEEVGWTLHIPPGSKLNQLQLDSLIAATRQKMRVAGNISFDLKGLHVLFAFFDPPYNSLAAGISRYDTTQFSSWSVFHTFAKGQLMKVFAGLQPRMQVLDTTSTMESIGGVLFHRFYIKTYYPENQVTLNTYWYNCEFRGYDFGVNVSYSDEATGKVFLNILKQSTFDSK